MNQTEKMLQTASSVGEYLAPSVKVVEVRARMLLLEGSNVGSGIDSLGNEYGEW